jgi:hypothetical protein
MDMRDDYMKMHPELNRHIESAGLKNEGSPDSPYYPDVEDYSPYDGGNINDTLYHPSMQQYLKDKGHSGLRNWDMLGRGEIDTAIVTDPESIYNIVTKKPTRQQYLKHKIPAKVVKLINEYKDPTLYHASPIRFDEFKAVDRGFNDVNPTGNLYLSRDRDNALGFGAPEGKGYLYDTKIQHSVNELLDLTKPINQQTPENIKRLQDAGFNKKLNGPLADIIDGLAAVKGSHKKVFDKLRSAGIPGHINKDFDEVAIYDPTKAQIKNRKKLE